MFISIFVILISSNSASASTIGFDSGIEIENIRTDAVKLVVATRHDSSLYQKYATYFANSELGASVGITDFSEISFIAPTTYAAFQTALTNPAIGASVAWGGGPTVFNNLAVDGLLRTIDDPSLLNWISANISDTIAGAEMKKFDGSDLKWVAAAISSFGFTVNNATLASRNLPFPTTWEDLASPAYYTSASQVNIAMGNAPDTTSNTRIYQIILQKFGWERGWEILYSMAGNSDIFGGSVETRSAVQRGDVAVAMTIDFYGVIVMGANPDTQYVIPEGASIVNGDPIAISANAPDLDAARAFTKYVLSAEGQALWTDDRINRLPVRADGFDFARTLVDSDDHISDSQIDLIENLYEVTLANEGIAFDEDLALSLEEAMRYHFESTITSVHPQLRDSWGAIATAYNLDAFENAPDQRLDQLVDIYGDPAINLTYAQEINDDMINDVVFRQQKQGEWEETAIAKYNAVIPEVTAPYTFTVITTSVFETTDSSGNTVTTTSVDTVVDTGTASTVDDSVTDVPVNALWVIIALIGPHLGLRYRRRGKRE